MRVVAAVFVAACSSPPQRAAPKPPPPPPPPPSLAAIAGTWSGMGFQPDVQAPVEVQLTIERDAAIGAHVGTIAYPRSSCSAELTRVEAPPMELRAREHMTANPDDVCIDGGTIVVPLVPTADGLDWRWLFPDGRVGVTATLAR